MKTVARWAGVYLLLLSLLTAIGTFNYQQKQKLQLVLDKEGELTGNLTRLTRERYELLSPLALRDWAQANGYIPMSLAQWQLAPERKSQ